MRVTKIVKEYITEEVNKRIPCKDLPEYAELNNRFNAARESYFKALDAVIDDIIASTNETYNLPDGWKIKKATSSGYIQAYPDDGNLYNLNREHKNVIQEKRRKAINNILVTLELGGTKAELEEMLNKIGESEEV